MSATVVGAGESLVVSLGERPPLVLHALFVRDACGCGTCRRPATNERLLAASSIDPSIRITDADAVEDTLRVVLSDGHTAELGRDWIVRYADSLERVNPADGCRLWTSGAGETLTAFERSELDDPRRLVDWLDATLDHGAAVVRAVPPDDDGLRGVARLVGEIRATNYGVTWEIAATVAPVSAVESERHLFVHTDLPYRAEPPGVQLLLASVVDVEGGASTLVDGFAAAERLRLADPGAWELLTRIEFTFPYVRDDVEIHGRAPLIGLAGDGRYRCIRRAPDLVGVPTVTADETPSLYAAVAHWNALLDDPSQEVSIRLDPGELLAFDNHRMLHGRTAFELGTSGRRLLLGCYLDRDDVVSRRAVVARSL